jgi:hypothetical protein
VLEPSAEQLPVVCDALGSLDTNPVLYWAGALWDKLKQPFTPSPLHAAAAAWDKKGTTGDLPGLSFISWAKVLDPYRDAEYAWVTIGKKTGQLPCETCDLGKVPRGWFDVGFDDSAWNTGSGAFGSSPQNAACELSSTVSNEWPAADPRFNPPQITELLLRKNVFIENPTDEHTGGISLQVRMAGRNDFRAYLNGTEITEFVTQPSVNLKKAKGWIRLAGGCPSYDEVIITVPENLILFDQDNLLAVRARSSADEPSFADVQVNINEAN